MSDEELVYRSKDLDAGKLDLLDKLPKDAIKEIYPKSLAVLMGVDEGDLTLDFANRIIF